MANIEENIGRDAGVNVALGSRAQDNEPLQVIATMGAKEPEIRDHDNSAWAKFLKDFRRYRKHGGRKSIQTLIPECQLTILECLWEKDPYELSEEEVIEKIMSIVQPEDVYNLFEDLRALRVNSSNGFQLNDVLAYVTKFLETVNLFPEAQRPKETELVKMFRNGLTNGKLKDSVFMYEVQSLTDATQKVVQSAYRIHTESKNKFGHNSNSLRNHINRGEKKDNTRWTPRLEGRASTNAYVKQMHDMQPHNQAQTQRRNVVCYGCKDTGHIMRDCPHKDKWAPPRSRNPSSRYDASVSAIRVENMEEKRKQTRMDILNADASAIALYDTGASDNFVSGRFYEKYLKGKVKEIPVDVRIKYANRQYDYCSTAVMLDLRIHTEQKGQVTFPQTFFIVGQDMDDDVYLGYPWMKAAGLLPLNVVDKEVSAQENKIVEETEDVKKNMASYASYERATVGGGNNHARKNESAVKNASGQMCYDNQANLKRGLVRTEDGRRVERYGADQCFKKMDKAQNRILETSKAHQNNMEGKQLNKLPDDSRSFIEEEYVADKIVDHRHGPDKNKSSMKFLGRWKGYEPDEDTWEPYEHVKGCEALDEYVKIHPDLHSKGG